MYMVGRAFGKLPKGGGVAEQPADIVEAFYYLYLIERAAVKGEQEGNIGNLLVMMGLGRYGG